MNSHGLTACRIGSRFLIAALFSAALLFPVATQAAPLVVGGAQSPVAEPVDAGMTMVAGGVPIPYVGIGFSGTLVSTVWTNDAENPFGLDKLTFTYLIDNAADSLHVLHRLTVNNYTGFQTDVSYDPASVGIVPTQVDRSTADVVGFSFHEFIGPGPIPPGGAGRMLVVQTDATAFAPTIASVINGGVATMASFAPIPEPSTWILGSMGLVALLVFVRRVRR